MTVKHNCSTMASIYKEAQAAVAKMQAENAELRAKCNMPPSPDDCQPVLQRLYDGTRAESDAMQNGYEAHTEELTISITKLQNIIAHVAGGGNIPKLLDGSALRHDDYYAISDNLDAQQDMTVAAQNGRDIRGDGSSEVWRRSGLIDEFIQNPKLLHATTLLEPIKFEYLTHKVEQHIEKHGEKLYYII